MRQQTLRFGLFLIIFSMMLQAKDTFKNVEYLYKEEGKDKGKQISGKLEFDATTQTIVFRPNRKKDSTLELRGPAITNSLYERTSKPRYAAGLLLAWPLLFTKTKNHFLTIQYKSESGDGKYAIFHLDKGNYREILAAEEATTGKKLERTEER